MVGSAEGRATGARIAQHEHNFSQFSWRLGNGNSNRRDVAIEPARDRFNEPQSTTLLPPDERPVMKWNGNSFRIDGGNGGRSEDDGAFFLLPYWMGRFLGALLE